MDPFFIIRDCSAIAVIKFRTASAGKRPKPNSSSTKQSHRHQSLLLCSSMERGDLNRTRLSSRLPKSSLGGVATSVLQPCPAPIPHSPTTGNNRTLVSKSLTHSRKLKDPALCDSKAAGTRKSTTRSRLWSASASPVTSHRSASFRSSTIWSRQVAGPRTFTTRAKMTVCICVGWRDRRKWWTAPHRRGLFSLSKPTSSQAVRVTGDGSGCSAKPSRNVVKAEVWPSPGPVDSRPAHRIRRGNRRTTPFGAARPSATGRNVVFCRLSSLS